MALFLEGKGMPRLAAADIEDRELAQIISLLRLGLGVGFFLFPGRMARAWTGEPEISAGARMTARSLGARDAAIAVGTMAALDGEGNVRAWLEAGALADASDAVATVTNWGSLPRFRRLLTLATAVGATVVGLNLAQSLSDQE